MRAIWTSSLSFGLINLPIRLYNASEEHALSFDLLHKKDLSPIRYVRICQADGREVPYQDIVKGYQYRKGDYVILVDEDFKRAKGKVPRNRGKEPKITDIDDIISLLKQSLEQHRKTA